MDIYVEAKKETKNHLECYEEVFEETRWISVSEYISSEKVRRTIGNHA